MKKTLQTLSALVLSLVMLLALAVPAFAAGETFTITISNSSADHVYEAYQIFSGRLEGSVLSDIVWGSGITAAGQSALKEKLIDAEKVSTATAADVANALAKVSGAEEVRAIADIIGQNLNTVAGTSTKGADAYKITDLAPGYYLVKDRDGSQTGANDAYTRFILEVVGNVTAAPKTGTVPTVTKKVLEGTEYKDVADYNIGDTISFQITGTLPGNYADYASYKYIFHDTLSSGLTYVADSAKVYVGGNTITADTVTHSDGSLTVTFNDLKGIPSISAASVITVEYTATLNASAVIGGAGNPNTVYLEYSNDPNVGSTGATGRTVTDKVTVFTYALDVTKVDGEDADKFLGGAEFKLKNAAGKYAQVESGKLTGWTENEAEATTLTSAETTGLFQVIGLDAGTYSLKETKAPVGYNKLDSDVELIITAAAAKADGLTKLEIKVGEDTQNGTLSTGIVNLTVANNKGATLPSTGGVGTTIFYVVGGVLMLGAVVALVTKKRIDGKD